LVAAAGSDEIRRQFQPLFQFDDIDAAGFQHRAAVGQFDLVQREAVEARADAGFCRRQETRAHAPGARAEPQVEARGLDLVLAHRHVGRDGARFNEGGYALPWQDAGGWFGDGLCNHWHL
jgi:hypothetical protein